GIYYVNWFRKSPSGKWPWPGFGENSRVLKWIFERCDGGSQANATPIGNVPTPDALDLAGLNIPDQDMAELLAVNPEDWQKEISGIRQHLDSFGTKLPSELLDELKALE